jgi:hypothetical protein
MQNLLHYLDILIKRIKNMELFIISTCVYMCVLAAIEGYN